MAPLQRHLAAERELGFWCALQSLDLDWHPVDHRAAHDRGAIQGPRLAHLEVPERNLAQITHAACFNPVAQNRPAVYFGR
jgi:hypothetical protein